MRTLKKATEYIGIGLGIILLVWLSTTLDRALNPLENKYASSGIQFTKLPLMKDQTQTAPTDSVLTNPSSTMEAGIIK